MKSFFIFLAVVAIIAALTNPDQTRHREIIKAKLKIHLQQSMSRNSDNLWQKAGEAIGNFFGGAIIDEVVDNLVTTEDYALFSITTISLEGESNVIGIGAFGNVFLTEELDRALEEGMLEQ